MKDDSQYIESNFYFLRNRALQTEFARDEGTINFSTEDIPIASLARPTNQTSNKGKRRNIVNVGCFTSSSSSAPSGLATWADKKNVEGSEASKMVFFVIVSPNVFIHICDKFFLWCYGCILVLTITYKEWNVMTHLPWKNVFWLFVWSSFKWY